MNEKNKKKIINIVSAVLIAAAVFTLTIGRTVTEPENPLAGKTAEIQPENMVVSAAVTPDDDSETEADGKAQEKEQSEEEQPEEEKPEEQEKEEQPEEEKPPEEESQETRPGQDSEENKDGTDDFDQSGDVGENGSSGNAGDETVIPGGEKQVSIATDLESGVIRESQLKNDTLRFYAYLVNETKDMSLKIKIVNKDTGQKGRYLSPEKRDYKVRLAKGENRITLYIKDKGSTYGMPLTFYITYLADLADENKPQIGAHPPVITTNLDGRTENIKTNRFIFTVQATTYKDENLTFDHIAVSMDGKKITTVPTGNGVYEYDLYFDPPAIGDLQKHEITVLAWDDEGNSSFKSYNVTYQFVSEGDSVGTATITIDATTLGLGIIAEGFEYDIKQGEPASYAVMAALDYYGFEGACSGTLDVGFYLKSIGAAYIANGASIPAELWSKIEKDGLSLTGQSSRDKIGEFDYTEGSGWMYTINGSLYPGRGMSEYYLSDGDNIILRFTLAYGKDLGSTSDRGALSSYCGIWINGKYVPRHKMDEGKVIKEASCEEEGLWGRTCRIEGCGHREEEKIIPAKGHDYKETERAEATDSNDGYIRYTCQRCGGAKTEIIHKKDSKR